MIRFDSHGNLFGVAASGGAHGLGDVFEIAAGTETITDLADFDGTNGNDPIALVVDSQGNVFGVTSLGGASGNGKVFEVPSGSHTIEDVADFTALDSTIQPALVIDKNGNLFGIAGLGSQGASVDGVYGVAAGSHTVSTIASFDSSTFGSAYPDSLVMDSHGNLFGTLTVGNEVGVFEVAAGSNEARSLATLGPGGPFPEDAVLTVDSQDNLIGASSGHGTHGDVFELPAGSAAVVERAYFDGISEGNPPETSPNPTSVTVDSAGNVFGTTYLGGAHQAGMVFEVAAGSTTVADIADMPSDPTSLNGSADAASLILDDKGNLFGVTAVGGASNLGTVFEVSPKR